MVADDNDQNDNEEPRSLSQDEIDALFNNLEDESKTVPAVPDQSAQDASDNGGALDQDAIDALLLAQAAGEDSAQTPAEAQAPAENASLDQAAIDALLQESGEAAPEAGADQETTNDGHLGQAEIDALLAEAGGEATPASASEPVADAEDDAAAIGQSEIDALLADMGAGDSAVEESVPTTTDSSDAGVSQSEIDDLLKSMGADGAEESEPAMASTDEGPLGQSEIDALLNNMDAGAESVEPEATAPEPAVADNSGALDQNDIDSLLAGLDAEATVSEAEASEPEIAVDGPLGQGDIDALLADMGADDAEDKVEEVPANNETQIAEEEGALDQGAIDTLLASMNNDAPLPSQTDQLTTDAIVNIVAKQDESPGDESESDSESMIDQDDIDKLVRQMSDATGGRDDDLIGEMLQANEKEIDQLLDETAEQFRPGTDAIPTAAHGGTTAAPMTAPIQFDAAMMSPEELRGTRMLVIVAVFLLAMCTVTMFFIVQSVNNLTYELYQDRTADIQPKNDYEQDLETALTLLNSGDEIEVEKGIRFMRRIRRNYPNNKIDVSMYLAKHFQKFGAHQKAIGEFRAIEEQLVQLHEDPAYYLSYAKSLSAQKEYQQAIEVTYRILANESYFMRDKEPDGRERSQQDIENSRMAVQQAHLLLGQLYSSQLEKLALNPRDGKVL